MAEQQRIALITGANRGIGKEIAAGLLRNGVTVLVGSRDEKSGKAAVKELSKLGNAILQIIDVTDPLSVQTAAKNVEQIYGRYVVEFTPQKQTKQLVWSFEKSFVLRLYPLTNFFFLFLFIL